MNPQYQIPKGTKDIVGDEMRAWQFFESEAKAVMERYGFTEIRTPIMEATSLFSRHVGEGSDIVQKEMYTFNDRSERSLTLKPEGTAPIVRSFIEQGLDRLQEPSRFFYLSPMFRYERPQKGRQRQFHQLGGECFGIDSEFADAEMIEMLSHLCQNLGISPITIMINSLGCRSCRPAYVEKLKNALMSIQDKLCQRCHQRLAVNPLRVFDCKEETCQSHLSNAPLLVDSLCAACEDHFSKVQSLLHRLNITFQINPRIVRGLDYYTRTAFEFTSDRLGAQNTLIGGGRYDNLVEEMGGTATCAIGFGMGIERAIELISLNQKFATDSNRIFLATLGAMTRSEGLALASKLRREGVTVSSPYSDRSLKSQLKKAQQGGYRWVLILGDREVAEKKVILRDLVGSEQNEISLDEISAEIKKCLSHPSPPFS
jgi:histidyl-tRNA synthetase